MSEGITENMDGGRSFEEGVFLRFDSLDASIRNLAERVQVLETRSYDTKPVWERALKEIAGTRYELLQARRELSDARRELLVRLDRLEAVILDTRAGLREAEGRIEKLEEKSEQ